MLVRKKNPQWYPSEKKDLKVGETIDITDPQALIMAGEVTGIAEDGMTELSAYELYGVIVKDELKDFQDYLAQKKLEATKAALEKEKKELEAQLKPEVKVEVAPEVKVEEADKTVTPAKKK
jgi:hypothetical protein